jgi:hypothetical protein
MESSVFKARGSFWINGNLVATESTLSVSVSPPKLLPSLPDWQENAIKMQHKKVAVLRIRPI